MKLIITRHGETEENAAGIIQGHLPGKLSEKGIMQAKKVALRLKNEKIDFIYSSDLARAADTAKEIAKFHPRAFFEFKEELRERNLGEFQGKKKTELGFGKKEFKATALNPKNGETMEEIYKRAHGFIKKILSKHSSQTVLLVGHNGINKALIAVITGKKPFEIPFLENHANTSITVFELRGKKMTCFNCTKHLD